MTGQVDAGIEGWCGLECSLVRLGDHARDQFEETGHSRRVDDIARIASLGFSAVRYPVHWEAVARDGADARAWDWYDARLAAIRATDMRVIAGLVHHGSGPKFTSLVDPAFVSGLARFAGEVAARYPWVRDFTPVNEPLTTARFSALYGHWYPHFRDYPSFLRAVVNQCLATRDAMRAIRRVTPDARLVQTEDICRVFGDARAAAQVRHENDRRWLSLDLLCGRVDRHHPFWTELLACGIGERDLDGLVDEPSVPDIVGVNHYLSSDRYLDSRVEMYPADAVGGNGHLRYADVAASMVPDVPSEDVGWLPRLREVWDRYRLPIALTEVHNGCTREEQLRWVDEAVAAVHALKAEGADIRAMTAWSVMGAVDWRSLLTQRDGHYEVGLFDVRSNPPQPTALARKWRAIAQGQDQPVPLGDGWWRRNRAPASTAARTVPRPFLLLGGSHLSMAFEDAANRRGLAHLRVADRLSADDLRDLVRSARAWAIIDCLRPHRLARLAIAELAAREAVPLVTFSDHRVFRGSFSRSYEEGDRRSPACRAGHRLSLLEDAVLGRHRTTLLVRTSGTFGPWAGAQLRLPDSEEIAPTYLPDLADRTLDLLIDEAFGLWHVTGATAARRTSVTSRVAANDAASLPVPSRVLASGKGGTLGPLTEAMERCERDRQRLAAGVV